MCRSASKLRVAVSLEQCWHDVPGGTARAALDTVNALRSTRSVELIGVAARHRQPPVDPWVPSIPVAMLDLNRIALYESWHRFRWPSVQRATGPVDVIHVTGLAMPPKSAPIVATLHDLAFLRYPEYFTKHGLRFFDAAIRRMRCEADVVLCSSRATRLDAEAAGFATDKLRVVPLGARLRSVDGGAIASARERFGINGRFVLHLGTDEPRKNTAALVRVAARLPEDVQVVLAGGAGWGVTGVDAMGHVGRVVTTGFVTEADKWALLAGADVVCLPSFWEGFGLPALEAMAVGTPVVTSSETSLAEVVGDAGVCVDPHDDDALTEALGRVLDDQALADDLAERGRQRAATFTWEANAQMTIDAYRDAVGRG